MRVMSFLKLMIANICICLLLFALLPGASILETLKLLALGTVLSIAFVVIYPEVRGVKAGDVVAVVDTSSNSILGRLGTAEASGRKNQQIKISLNNGSEVVGLIESYEGIITPPRVRTVYEERLIGEQ